MSRLTKLVFAIQNNWSRILRWIRNLPTAMAQLDWAFLASHGLTVIAHLKKYDSFDFNQDSFIDFKTAVVRLLRQVRTGIRALKPAFDYEMQPLKHPDPLNPAAEV